MSYLLLIYKGFKGLFSFFLHIFRYINVHLYSLFSFSYSHAENLGEITHNLTIDISIYVVKVYRKTVTFKANSSQLKVRYESHWFIFVQTYVIIKLLLRQQSLIHVFIDLQN